ncbi:MAG: hypothetical protein AVDCRST_MAG68-5004, partial [uncultured Gemmatimonadetes bacterium]
CVPITPAAARNVHNPVPSDNLGGSHRDTEAQRRRAFLCASVSLC